MRRLLFVLALLAAAATARAERVANHYVKACGLTGTPSSVVADVYVDSAPGSILATIPNGDVDRIGTTDCYQADLATTGAAIGYPNDGDPTEKSYTVRFRDDATNVVSLTEVVAGIVGPDAKSGRCERATPIYAASPIPERGITQQVIAQGKPSYMKIDVDCSGAFSAPPVTYYEVFRYDGSARVESRTPSATVPSP